MHVFYISFDGILEPLGYSQIFRPLAKLSQDGVSYTLLTLEKPHSLSEKAHLQDTQEECLKAGIDWHYESYSVGGGSFNAVGNFRVALSAALEIGIRQSPDIVHARSYLGGIVALGLKRIMRLPYVFDFRGYWIDERLKEGRWFTRSPALHVGRFTETMLYQNAAAIVSLTRTAAEDLRHNRFGNLPANVPIEVIPTCVDYDDFTFKQLEPEPTHLPKEIRKRLRDKLVILFVGSVSRRYRLQETLRLFELLESECRDIHFLCLTRQESELSELLERSAVKSDSYTVTSAEHRDMPAWLRLADWGMLLTDDALANRAMMPTKLAEFFASGVRPIQYGCNSDVTEWVRRAGTGVVLNSLDEDALQAAAGLIVSERKSRTEAHDRLVNARETTRHHFSLESGVRRYKRLFESLV